MKRIAILPLRAGSRGIPGKNKKKLLGRPLYQWILGEAIFSKLDEIIVFTDDDDILSQIESGYGWTKKVKGMLRSPDSATDSASSELAMKEAANNLNNNFDIICLLQATSPLTSRQNINDCLKKIEIENFDSALTVVNSKRFLWNDKGESQNYNYLNRPRRQDFKGMLVENGAVYASKKETFFKSDNRLGGKIGLVYMPEDTLIEIDETIDWVVTEKLMQNRLSTFKSPPQKIKAIVFDVDGVFTNGTIGVSSDIELFKQFSVRDGMGFELLKQHGIIPIIMTSENSPIVEVRMKKLKISNLYMGVLDKFSQIEKVLTTMNLQRNQIAYVGDDINDLANIVSSGWGIVPSNAVNLLKLNADVILNNSGGDLVIRETVEFIEKYNLKFQL